MKVTSNHNTQITKILIWKKGTSGDTPEPTHIANTAETAYTVAKAFELIDAGEALSETVYVKGIVSQVDSYNETYKSITYWISDDGTTTKQLEVYSGKGLGGADFASVDDVKVGATVIVKGVLKKYKETYEFDKNNELVSYVDAGGSTPEEPGTLISEKDWTTETAYPYYNMGVPDGASYDVKNGVLEVTNTVKQTDIWGLQLFVLDWFNVTAGNDYVVRIYASVPVDGQVQVNMGTWGGADQHVFDITASEAVKAYDFEFPKYAGATTSGNDAHVLWQQGWLLGTVKIAKVQLFEVSSTGVMNMVAEKAVDGIRYNLAGQKVGDDFKGIVIKNGKKFVNK